MLTLVVVNGGHGPGLRLHERLPRHGERNGGDDRDPGPAPPRGRRHGVGAERRRGIPVGHRRGDDRERAVGGLATGAAPPTAADRAIVGFLRAGAKRRPIDVGARRARSKDVLSGDIDMGAFTRDLGRLVSRPLRREPGTCWRCRAADR